jgi:hypothetical protein
MKDIPNNFYNLDIYGKSSKRPYNPRGKMFGYHILGFGSGGEFDFTLPIQRGIFAFGYAGSARVNTKNLVGTNGVVASDASGAGTARNNLAATTYGGNKAIFAFGTANSGNSAVSNLVSNTGVIATDTSAVANAKERAVGSTYGF